jgi:nitroimidazol reductase NimA-like FMN-containing flavoprotein (pyridoxamine 5'-phosphate oxidase superfamily)
MLLHELTVAQCKEVMKRTSFARLACARHGQPYIVPMFCYFDAPEGFLYGFSTVGQKIEWMRANPKVCVEFDDVEDQFHWTTVLAFGRYEECDTAAGRAAWDRAQRLFGQRAEWWLPAAGRLASGVEHGVPVVYRIRIDSLTGRQADRPTRAGA